MPRRFVAVWLPEDVVGLLCGLERRADPAVRWTTPAQWHATLRFLGEVGDDERPALEEALRAAAAASGGPLRVRLGPATTRLGGGVLAVPLAGLERLAAAVADHTAPLGAAGPARAWVGHVTLARSRGRGRLPADLAGVAVDAGWWVKELTLVRSRLHPAGARYEVEARVPLA